jgi:hypothetical protein
VTGDVAGAALAGPEPGAAEETGDAKVAASVCRENTRKMARIAAAKTATCTAR